MRLPVVSAVRCRRSVMRSAIKWRCAVAAITTSPAGMWI